MALGVGGTVVAKARAVLEADTRGMDRALSQSEKRWSSWHGNAVKASAAVGVALLAASKVAIDAASNLNEEVDKSRVVFGKHSEALEGWAATADKAFGASKRQALEFAGVFGSMLRPMGFTEKAAGGMSKALVQLGGDMASFNNANIEDTLQALRSGLSGETEPLRKFGVFLNEDRIAAQALGAGLVKASVDMGKVKDATERVSLASQKAADAKKKYGEGTEQHRRALLAVSSAERALAKELDGKIPKLTAAQKAESAYQIILKDTALQQGNFKDTAESAANSQRRLAAETENLQAKLGQGLLPAYKEALSTASSLVDMMSEHETATKTTITVVGGLAAAVLAVSAATKVYTAATTVATAATAASGPALMAYRASLWATAAAGAQVTLSTKAMAAAQAILTKTPLGIILGGVALAIGAVAFKSDEATDKIREQADAARDAALANSEWAGTLQSVRDQQSMLAGNRLQTAETGLGLKEARQNLKDVRSADGFKKGSDEEVRAILAVTRARLTHKQAIDSERDAVAKTRSENAQAITQARAAASELSRLGMAKRELAEATRAERAVYAYGGSKEERAEAKERLQIARETYAQLEASEEGHRKTLRTLQEKGLVDVVQIGDQTQVLVRRQGEATAGIARAGARRAARGANGELAKIGDVKLDREMIVENLVAPFLNIGKSVKDAVGTIRVPIDAVLKFTGMGGFGGGAVGPMSSVDALTPLAASAGLVVTSGYRPGDDGYHGSNQARDYGGSAAAMSKFATMAMAVYGSKLKELIYSPLGVGIKNGQRVNIRSLYGDAVYADHFDHVHVALQHGGRVPGMPWSPPSGDSVPALLEPDEVVVNRSFTRAYPGGPGAFDRDTNGAVPRFATGGVIRGSVTGGKRAEQLRAAAEQRRENELARREAEKARREAEAEARAADAERQAAAAQARRESDAAALRARVVNALASRVFDNDIASLRARGTKDDLSDDLTALDGARGINADRVSMLQGAMGEAVDWETRNDLQNQLNDAIRTQIELDQQRTDLIDQQIEAEKQREAQRQADIASSVSRAYALSDAERDLLAAKAEATEGTDDDKAVLQSQIDTWTAKLGEIQRLQQDGTLTEATRIDLIGQEAAATRALSDATKRQTELAKSEADVAKELEAQIQSRIVAERDAILGARSRFQSEFASNTFSPNGRGGAVNGAASATQVQVVQNFSTPPEDPFVWLKKSEYAAGAVFGG